MIYPDTSALVPLFKVDRYSEASRIAMSEAAPIAISDFAVAELSAALAASARNYEMSADKFEALLARIDGWVAAGTQWIVTDPADIRAATGFVRRVDLGLRAPDALHLAICARVGATLLTFDDRQAAAARTLRVRLAA